MSPPKKAAATRSRQRRDDEKEQRREALIDAAELVFATAGFETAKVEDVAKQARVSRALVYLYFGRKDELLLAICLRALRRLRERFAAAAAGPATGYAQIAAIGRAYIDFAIEFPLYFAALSRVETQNLDIHHPGPNERAVLDASAAIHEVTVGALRHGMRDGTIRRLPQPMLMAMTLWGFIHGTIQIAQTKSPFLEQAGISVDAFLRNSIEHGLHGLEPRPAAKPVKRR